MSSHRSETAHVETTNSGTGHVETGAGHVETGHTTTSQAAGSGTLTTGTGTTATTTTVITPISLGDGTHRLVDNEVNAVITGGTGNNTITELGTGAVITLGGGNNVVYDRAGTATVTTGVGNQVIELGGTGNNVTVGNTLGGTTDTTSIEAGSGGATVIAGNGNINVTASGAGNNITVGTGNDVINLGNYEGNERGVATTAPITADTVHLGNGTNQVFLGGSGNTIYDGTGTDTIKGAAAGNDTFVINVGGGNVNISGFSLTNGDKLDLSSILPGAALATLGASVTVASQADALHATWTDTLLTIAGTGGTAHVTLLNTGATPLTLANLSTSSIIA